MNTIWKNSKTLESIEIVGGFHIDHIKPLCSFDLTDPEQIKQAFAPENLQWLTAEENMSKGSRIDYIGDKHDVF